jgi:hypothetical protein
MHSICVLLAVRSLGRKLLNSKANFSWYSTPKKIENSKWVLLEKGKSVPAFCVIDFMGQALAPKCTSASCKQPFPSAGIYKDCYIDCFFSTVVGPKWQTKVVNASTSAQSGQSSDIIQRAFADGFNHC